MVTSQSIFGHPDFKQLCRKPGNEFFALLAVILQQAQMLAFVFLIALVAYLYKLSATFEMDVQTPDKAALLGVIESVQEQVDQIYALKQLENGDNAAGRNDHYFKKTKVVAWLLNRPKENMKSEREDFFTRLNSWLLQ